MQSIRRLSLAFIMFSVFSVSYLVKPVFAEIVGASLTDKCEQHDIATHKTEQVNCLRSLLSETAPNFITPSKDGLGNWGCSSSDQAQHIDCLKNLLNQYTNGGMMNPLP